MNKIKFALVGCGSIGKRHVAVLDANQDVELVAICDIDESKCKELSELYGGIKYFTQYEDMLDNIESDVVTIATPHALHCPMAIDALNKGFHVLVEKPMALTETDCERMNSEAHKNPRKLWVVKQNRYNVPIKLAEEAIRDNKLGKIFLVKSNILWNRHQGYYNESPWRGRKDTEGGALYTQASHFIDLLIWLFGDVTSADTYMETQNHAIETEDTGMSLLKFSSGVLGSMIWTTCVYDKNLEGSITIIGEKGTIKIGGPYLNKIEYWYVEGYPLPQGVELEDKPNVYSKYKGTSSNHDKVIASVANDLRNNTNETVTGEEAMKTVEAIELMYKNSKNTSI